MAENLWSLKYCDLFEQLTSAELQRLESRSVVRTFRRGEVLYLPTDPGQSVLVVLRGRVKIKTLTPDGRETIFAFFEEGELFGELAILDEEPRREYAEAVTDGRVLAIPRGELLALMERRPGVALSITKLLGFRRRRIENRLRNVLFRSNRERLVALLLELLGTHGQQRRGGWEIGLRLSHQELAGLIGATRESVTLTLGRLQEEGLVRVERRRITVLNRARLTAEADAGAESPARLGGRTDHA